jgi:dihydrofolate reductase
MIASEEVRDKMPGLAGRTSHTIFSRISDKVAWKKYGGGSRHRRNPEHKQQLGKDVCAVEGATLISTLISQGLINDLRFDRVPFSGGKGAARRRKAAASMEAP